MIVKNIIIHLEHLTALSSQSGLAQGELTECHPKKFFFLKMQSEILSNLFFPTYNGGIPMLEEVVILVVKELFFE